MTIDDLVRDAHVTSVAHGWWDEAAPDGNVAAIREGAAPRLTPERYAAKLALVHSEVSEALECVRRGDVYGPFADELADIVIRVADLAGAIGCDLDEAIRRKMAYNKTRPERHGGKAL